MLIHVITNLQRSAISLEIKRILEFDSGGNCVGDEDKIFLTKLQIKIKFVY